MDNSYKLWTPGEDNLLKKLYKCLDVNDISKIHKRSCYDIAYRLFELGVVKKVEEVRGYTTKGTNPTWESIVKNVFDKVPKKHNLACKINELNKDIHRPYFEPNRSYENPSELPKRLIFELCNVIDELKQAHKNEIKQLTELFELKLKVSNEASDLTSLD